MSTLFGRHVFKHSDTIICPHCGRTGVIHWEEGKNADRNLLAIEGAFYERLCKKAPHPIELVCAGCGTAQPVAE
jgi:hypothetical protein